MTNEFISRKEGWIPAAVTLLFFTIYPFFTSGRGWVGWKQGPNRPEMVEITFEFDRVREFHLIHVFTNNQFSRDVAVFKKAEIDFSIGGETYPGEPVEHNPMEDSIFEEPRNVSVKLHRRVGKFLKVKLYFSAKWIMISEVSFESSIARGNYEAEKSGREEIDEEAAIVDDDEKLPRKDGVDQQQQHHHRVKSVESSSTAATSSKKASDEDKTGEDDSALMPIIVGVMTAVIVLLGVVIFFIVSRSRQRQKKWLSAPINEEGSEILTASEKITLSSASNAYPFNGGAAAHQQQQQQQHFGTVLGTTASSDTGSSGHSSGRMLHILPKLDDNYNTPVHAGGNMTPRTTARHPHTTNVTASPFYNNGSSIIRTPSGTRKTFPPAPRLQVPPPPPHPPTDEEAVYTEPGTYTEPYRAVRYSPYYGYGPVVAEDALMKQALLSGE